MNSQPYILQDNASLQRSRKQLSLSRLAVELTAQLLLVAGVLGLLLCFFADNTARVVLGAIAAATLVWLSFVSTKPSRPAFFRLLPLAAAAVAVALQGTGGGRALLAFFNQCIALTARVSGALLLQFQAGEPTFTNRLAFFALLTVLLCYFVRWVVRRHKILALALLAAVVVVVASVGGLNYGLLPLLCLLAGICITWLMIFGGNAALRGRLALLVAAAVVFTALGVLMASGPVRRLTSMVRTSFTTGFEELRFGSDPLPRGNLTVAASMQGSAHDDALRLTMQTPQKLYLKGFVGSTFSGTTWSDLSTESFSNEEIQLLRWLQEQNFSTNFQFAEAEQLQKDHPLLLSEAVTVENVGANSHYLYLPYTAEALISGTGRAYRDVQMRSAGLLGCSHYSYSMLQNDYTAEILVADLDTADAAATTYDQVERVYRTFVYDNYLDLTDAQRTKLEELFFSGSGWADASLYQVASQIRLVLQTETSYTKDPAAYNGSTEFLSWFFDVQKGKGNAAYYATAATLAFRAAGYPARYVEGYYLSEAKARDLQAAGATEVSLTEADTHAWAEVYVDSFGWLPIDVIPGFYYAQYTTQPTSNAPQSNVSIKDDTAEAQFLGGSSDAVPPGDGNEEEKPDIAQKVWHLLGLLVAVLLGLWVLHLLVLLAYFIRRSAAKRRLKNATNSVGARICYHHTCRMLAAVGLPVQEDYPERNVADICARYPDIKEFEVRRFIALLQKVVFGRMELSEAEYLTVRSFDQKVTSEVLETLPRAKYLKVKYWQALG